MLRSSPRYVAYRITRSLPGILGLFLAEQMLTHRGFQKLDQMAGVHTSGVGWLLAGKLATFVVFVVLPACLNAYRVSLEYAVRSYVLSDRALRVRAGLFRVRETTMTFANVQNIVITRGPLQGLFGISDVVVRSAGGGDATGLHVVRLEAMPEAAEVEAMLHELVKRTADRSKDRAPDAGGILADLVDAARALRETADVLTMRS